MPEQNGQRTTNEWLQIISRVEEKTNRLAVKVGGIAVLMTAAGVWLKSVLFGQ